MKILIIGDSFSADDYGWPSMLDIPHDNFSENGVGEYKIYKQLKDADKYDKILINHTSPWRVNTPYHPVHYKNKERPNNDFIIADVEYHSKKVKDMRLVKKYFNKFYDFEYQLGIYNLLVEKLMSIPNSIHITFHSKEDTNKIPNNFNSIWEKNQGNINHMDYKGNYTVTQLIKKLL